MGLRIGELLLHEGLITPTQLDTALKAQKIFGGRLGTNLVEHGFVDEEALARLLAAQLGIPTCSPEQLASIPRGVISLVPSDLARRHGVVPFHHDEERDRVAIAMADPNNLQRVDEIQFALGRSVSFHVAPEVLLGWALERYYGVERQRRFIRMAGVPAAEMQVDPRRDAAPGARRTGTGAASVASNPDGTAPRRSFADATLARILEAPGKRELIDAVTDSFATRAEQVLFLAARGGELLAWEARGLPLPTERLRTISFSAAQSPSLEHLLAAPTARRLAPADDPALRDVLEGRLFLDCSSTLLMLPLVVNRQPFGLFVFARDDEEATDALRPVLVELLKRVACKLQVFYLEEYLAAPLPDGRAAPEPALAATPG